MFWNQSNIFNQKTSELLLQLDNIITNNIHNLLTIIKLMKIKQTSSKSLIEQLHSFQMKQSVHLFQYVVLMDQIGVLLQLQPTQSKLNNGNMKKLSIILNH
ncbi:unnamed protein product [Paramecium primaurelia]|uniref:Uncharacterized protein n=1 Tax=Paramecium primaurelia TaxID=5886 RepID=A0A8S1MGR0_PARPR|nr:unnamed protein product [Paramecium primaurelia]